MKIFGQPGYNSDKRYANWRRGNKLFEMISILNIPKDGGIMFLRLSILAMMLLILAATAAAQNACDNPYPDTCRYPDTCCAITPDNCPWNINQLDPLTLVSFFKGGAIWGGPFSKYDVDCNCSINAIDLIYLVNFRKGRGPAPKCCFYQCQFHAELGEIGNLVWNDINLDGIKQPVEHGIGQISVQLLDCATPPNVLEATLTDSLGFYAFDSLNAGNYRVRFLCPDSLLFTLMNQDSNDYLDSDADPETGMTDCINLSVNQIDFTWDAGLYKLNRTATIGDFIWHDRNHNGIQDRDEEGMIASIQLYTCDSIMVVTAVSDSNGHYLIQVPQPGQYFLFARVPDNMQLSPYNQGNNDSTDSDIDPATGISECLQIDSGTVDLTLDVGMFNPAEDGIIGDRVWLDYDRDGIQDVTESGIAGIPVDLIYYSDHLYVLASDTTDANGLYQFTGIPSANYQLHFWLTDEYVHSPQDQGNNDSLDSDVNPLTGSTEPFHLGIAEINNNWDMGLYWYPYHGGIGDLVWNDLNHNGIQEQGEPGIPGVHIYLYSCGDSVVIESTTTNESGYYLFAYLPIANAFLHFLPPPEYFFSPQDQGGNDSLDSDVNPQTGLTRCIYVGEGNADSTWDAGMYRQTQDEGCTYSAGYWKNHAGFGHQADSVSHHLPLWIGTPDGSKSIEVDSACIAFYILLMNHYGLPFNGITKLYAQLLAAKLNIANGADGYTVTTPIAAADLFLADHNWLDWYRLSHDEKIVIRDWKNLLDDYNSGQIGPGNCNTVDR
jgi:hypothetical protein